MWQSVSKCVSLVFARGWYYGAEWAICWALPCISSVSTLFIRTVDKTYKVCWCSSCNLHVGDKTSKPMSLEQCQWTPVEADSVLCCRWSLWQRGVSSAAAESVHVLRVSHLWLHTTHRDPPDGIGMELPGQNTPPPPVAGPSPAGELQHTVLFFLIFCVSLRISLVYACLNVTNSFDN